MNQHLKTYGALTIVLVVLFIAAVFVGGRIGVHHADDVAAVVVPAIPLTPEQKADAYAKAHAGEFERRACLRQYLVTRGYDAPRASPEQRRQNARIAELCAATESTTDRLAMRWAVMNRFWSRFLP